MRYGNVSAHLDHIRRIVAVGDHLFEINLTPSEALALLEWLRERHEDLEELARGVPESEARPAYSRVERSVSASMFASELWRRVGDVDVNDVPTAEIPGQISGER